MNIYSQDETDFVHNGIGFLTDVLNVKVTDNLNGDYSLFFEYKINGNLNEYLRNENIVKCKVYDGSKQLFVIKNIIKTFDSIQVHCKHIFYQLLDNFLDDVAPTNLSGQPFLKWILDRTMHPNNFIPHSDIAIVKSARFVRKNPIDAILGSDDNSMVNLFGGELKRDNFNIYFNSFVGYDNGIKLIIGKNISGINITMDTNSVHTRIIPQGFDGLLLPEKYIDSPLINNYTTPKICKIEFENIKYDLNDASAYQNLDDAYEALRNAVNELFKNGIDKPNINIKIDWIELSKTNEYKNYSNLEKVGLGDVITIDLLGVVYKTRVIKIVYNPEIDMIENFELGTPKTNIGTITNTIQKKVEQISPNSILKSARDSATQMITKALGGYVYKTQNELFIMDTDNPDTATKIWRWNMNGLGYSENGVDGPYKTAITSDGKIVADFITTGKLDTNIIEGYDSITTTVKESQNLLEEQKNTTDNLTSNLADINSDIGIIQESIGVLKETMLTQTAEAFEMLFSQTGIADTINKIDGALNNAENQLNTITEYIRFEGAKIILGKSTSQSKLIIENDIIKFMTGDNISAYISENQLYITDSTILNKLQISNWETKPDSKGNLNTRWVGEN